MFYRTDVVGNVRKHGNALYVCKFLRSIRVDVGGPNVVAVHLIDCGLFVVSVYRPPSFGEDENYILIDFISMFCFGRSVVILGDFNLPSIAWDLEFIGPSYMTPIDRKFF